MTPKNVLIIVADDVGYTDLGYMGGEIPTPNIDKLASEGVVLASFYTAPTCSPTRAMLLTGVDAHQVGLGTMGEVIADNQRGRVGYEGYLNMRAATLAEVLREHGFDTFMAGKWHLGADRNHTAFARGFSHAFEMSYGGASHFSDMQGPTTHQRKAQYLDNGELISELPGDFYSSDFYADWIIDRIRGSAVNEKPFFGYLAFTAAHWPLQAPDKDIDRFKGRYDDGYDRLRAERIEGLKGKGIIRRDVGESQPKPIVTEWAMLSEDERQYEARKMEVYAAMISNLDENVGKVIAALKESGELDRTIIIFMSDNGAEGNPLAGPLFDDWVAEHDNSLENIGRRNSFVTLGPGWAEASSGPLRSFKAYTAEGGIRVPAIIRVPKVAEPGRIEDHIVVVQDLFPTIIDLLLGGAGIDLEGKNRDLTLSGESVAQLLTESASSEGIQDRVLGWELFGRTAIRRGNWKALIDKNKPGERVWELYNLDEDIGEHVDQAARYPGILERLKTDFDDYSAENGVVMPSNVPAYGQPTDVPSEQNKRVR